MSGLEGEGLCAVLDSRAVPGGSVTGRQRCSSSSRSGPSFLPPPDFGSFSPEDTAGGGTLPWASVAHSWGFHTRRWGTAYRDTRSVGPVGPEGTDAPLALSALQHFLHDLITGS